MQQQKMVEEVPQKIYVEKVSQKIHSKAGALKNIVMEIPL